MWAAQVLGGLDCASSAIVPKAVTVHMYDYLSKERRKSRLVACPTQCVEKEEESALEIKLVTAEKAEMLLIP